MKVKTNIHKLIRQYREFRQDDMFNAPEAFLCTVRSIFYRLFRKEEYGDMMCFHFIKFKHPDIYKTMFTKRDNAALLPLVNDESELPILREKHRLMEILNGAGRSFFYAPESSEIALQKFIKDGGNNRYILKPDNNAGSRGISFLNVNDDALVHELADGKQINMTIPDLFKYLSDNNIIMEEYIQQHEKLNEVFDRCVNTIFIHTVRLPDGNIEISGLLYAEFGCSDSRFVNSGNDLVVGINDDGTLFPFGFLRNEGYRDPSKAFSHPDSGVQFEGFEIPYWKEAIALVIETAKKIPQLTYIKWDVAITENGPVIIEGNGMPGGYRNGQAYSLEARHVGTKKDRSEFLHALAFSKTLTPEKIETINRMVIGNWDKCSNDDIDAVVVLGSARAISRIETAYDMFKENSKITYILCGGNESIYPKKDSESEMLSEAEFMKQNLLEKGIQSDRIIVDNTSKNTKENLNNAIKVLNDIGAKKVAFVSAWFHGKRVRDLLMKMHNSNIELSQICFVPAYGSNTRPDNWYKSMYGIQAMYHEWKYC